MIFMALLPYTVFLSLAHFKFWSTQLPVCTLACPLLHFFGGSIEPLLIPRVIDKKEECRTSSNSTVNEWCHKLWVFTLLVSPECYNLIELCVRLSLYNSYTCEHYVNTGDVTHSKCCWALIYYGCSILFLFYLLLLIHRHAKHARNGPHGCSFPRPGITTWKYHNCANAQKFAGAWITFNFCYNIN